MVVTLLLIDGLVRPGYKTFERRSPLAGSVVTYAAAATKADAIAAADAAARALTGWAERGPNARRAILLK